MITLTATHAFEVEVFDNGISLGLATVTGNDWTLTTTTPLLEGAHSISATSGSASTATPRVINVQRITYLITFEKWLGTQIPKPPNALELLRSKIQGNLGGAIQSGRHGAAVLQWSAAMKNFVSLESPCSEVQCTFYGWLLHSTAPTFTITGWTEEYGGGEMVATGTQLLLTDQPMTAVMNSDRANIKSITFTCSSGADYAHIVSLKIIQ